MAGWQAIGVRILHILTQPVVWLLQLLVYILYWIVSPFVYLAYAIQAVLAWPIRLLAHFEALWYFLFCGVLVGVIFGGSSFGIYQLSVLTFGLNRKPVPEPIPAQGHDAASYRAARTEKKRKEKEKKERQAMRARLLASQPLVQEMVREARNRPVTSISPLSPNTSTVATRSGLFQDIILEQTDEEDIGSDYSSSS